MAGRQSRYAVAALGPREGIVPPRRHRRAIHEAGDEKVPGHEVGRPRRLPSDRQQTLRRLASLIQVSRQGSRHLRKVREGTPRVSRRSRGAVQRRFSPGRADRDLQDRRTTKEVRPIEEPGSVARAAVNFEISTKRLVVARTNTVVPRTARSTDLRKRDAVGFIFPLRETRASRVSTGNKMRGGIERALPIEVSVHYCRCG